MFSRQSCSAVQLFEIWNNKQLLNMNSLKKDEHFFSRIFSDQQQEFLTNRSQDYFSQKSFYQKLYELIWWLCYQMSFKKNEYLCQSSTVQNWDSCSCVYHCHKENIQAA